MSRHSKINKSTTQSTPATSAIEAPPVGTQNQKSVQDVYERVVSLKDDQNLSVRAIATQLAIPKSTVQDYLQRWKKKISSSNLQKKGRPKLFDSGDKKFVRRLLKTNPLFTVEDVQNELQTKRSKKASRSTVRRLLKDMNLRYGKPQIVPLLTNVHLEARMKFCRTFVKKKKLGGIFFSDETYVELGSGDRGVWYKTGKRPKCGKPKFVAKLMFWAAISCQAKSPLIAIDGTMNSERYIGLLRDEFFTWVRSSCVKFTSFQQDNASCHVSKRARSFFETENIRIIDWPANSPDLNPIEIVWSILKERVRKRNPTTKDQLKLVAIEEWAQIPQKVIAKTINSLPKRCTQVLERLGKKCDY